MTVESLHPHTPTPPGAGLFGFGGSPLPDACPRDFPHPHLERLARACLLSLDDALDVVQDWRRGGRDLEDIYLHGIAPCARLLGWWWRCDTADFAQVTIASTQLQRVMQHLSAEFCASGRPHPSGRSLLLTTPPQSQHTMGTYMLAEFCRRHGWQVLRVAPDEAEDVLAPLRRDWFDAVGLSLSATTQLQPARALLARVRAESPNPRLKVFAGGPLVQSDPEAARSLGVDLLVGDARETVKLLGEMVISQKN